MNNIFKYSVCVFSIIFFFTSCQTNEKTDVENAGLKGNVKSVREISYEAFGNADTLVKGDIISTNDSKNCFISYNRNGYITNVTEYDEYNEKNSTWLYRYDKKGERILNSVFLSPNNEVIDSISYIYGKYRQAKEYVRYSEGEVVKKFQRTFDKKGNITSEKILTSDNSIERISKFLYSNDLLKEVQVLDDNNNILSECYYTYDNKKNMSSMTLFGGDKKYISKGKYLYNKEGFISCEVISRPGYTDLNLNYIYTTDAKGNWVQRIMLSDNEAYKITTRQIEYYD
ncbi:MAG: hypothetical protein IJ213_02660 [Bacteroidales bacterium]|nr:hypothetical protein [Bacteroidales bacterium]